MSSMATAHLSADELLNAIQRLGLRDIDQLISRLLRLRAERTAPSASSRETELLLRINQGLPEAVSSRYQSLMVKRLDGTLTPDEHRELLSLTDEAEAHQAQRAQYLADLARLRGISLRALVEELGLQPSPDA
jgi:hypothetical protein